MAEEKSKPLQEERILEASWRLPLVGDEDYRDQGKLILDLGGLLMEAATVKEFSWPGGPPNWMKTVEIRATILWSGSGRGRVRSGEIEAVKELDPDRAF